jgi:putative flavoprotein involved in K+ transport
MESTDATDFRITDGEEPAEADGVVTAWINFDTAVGRGSGLLRLNDEGAWTLLTTLDELKGHEERQGETRPKGVQHGATGTGSRGRRRASPRSRASAATATPTCW